MLIYQKELVNGCVVIILNNLVLCIMSRNLQLFPNVFFKDCFYNNFFLKGGRLGGRIDSPHWRPSIELASLFYKHNQKVRLRKYFESETYKIFQFFFHLFLYIVNINLIWSPALAEGTYRIMPVGWLVRAFVRS